jgi:hypothetical protein
MSCGSGALLQEAALRNARCAEIAATSLSARTPTNRVPRQRGLRESISPWFRRARSSVKPCGGRTTRPWVSPASRSWMKRSRPRSCQGDRFSGGLADLPAIIVVWAKPAPRPRDRTSPVAHLKVYFFPRHAPCRPPPEVGRRGRLGARSALNGRRGHARKRRKRRQVLDRTSQ